MATIALFIALGGTSVAAIQLGRNTVGSQQIVNESIASGDIDRGAVRSSDIHNGTITHRDVRNGTMRGRDMATNTVGSRNLADSGVHADDLAAGAVTGRAIRDGTITAGDLADGTIPEGTAADDPRLSDARTPTGNAGGDLAGTFPNPVLGDGAIDSADLFTAPLRDGAAGQPTLRTLGNGADQAAAGNDPRLSDARTPTGNAGGDLTGTYPSPTIDAGAVDSAKVANGSLRLTDFAVLNGDGGFSGGTIGANDCALAGLSLGTPPQAGDRVFFLFPNSVPTSVSIPPQVWPGGNSITTNVCNMDNAPATVPNTLLTVLAFR